MTVGDGVVLSTADRTKASIRNCKLAYATYDLRQYAPQVDRHLKELLATSV